MTTCDLFSFRGSSPGTHRPRGSRLVCRVEEAGASVQCVPRPEPRNEIGKSAMIADRLVADDRKLGSETPAEPSHRGNARLGMCLAPPTSASIVIYRTDPRCGFRLRYREPRRPSLRCPLVATAESSGRVECRKTRPFFLTIQRDLNPSSPPDP